MLNPGVEHGKPTANVSFYMVKKNASLHHGGIWVGEWGGKDIALLILKLGISWECVVGFNARPL